MILYSHMTHHSLLTIQGPDAAKFLQGQTTCDVNLLDENNILLGAQCNVKGRVLTSFVLARDDSSQHIVMRLRADITASCMESLQKYIVFSKAQLAQDQRLGLSITDTEHFNAPQWPQVPIGTSLRIESGLLLMRHSEQWLEVWGTEAALKEWLDNTAPEAQQHPSSAAELLHIQYGWAEICHATMAQFVPHALNYHLVEAISFDKGCYTGQEIIARMQYRGHSKKHAYLVSTELNDVVTAGYPLISTEQADKEVATVLACANDGVKTFLLIVASDEFIEKHTPLIVKNSNIQIEWEQQPYAIPKE